MFSKIITFVTLAIHSTLCLSQVPPTFQDNQWRIVLFSFQRFFGTDPPTVGGAFELRRTYYKPCPSDASSAAWLGRKCGWMPADNPVRCLAWGPDEGLGIHPPSLGYHSCSSYEQAAEGLRNTTEEERRYLRWQMFDLKENTTRDDPTGEGPFESVKLEIVNGIPLTKKHSNGSLISTGQVRTFKTTVSLMRENTRCGLDQVIEDSKETNKTSTKSYTCRIVMNPSSALKVSCGFLQSDFYDCWFFSNVTEGMLSNAEFLKRYK